MDECVVHSIRRQCKHFLDAFFPIVNGTMDGRLRRMGVLGQEPGTIGCLEQIATQKKLAMTEGEIVDGGLEVRRFST